MAAALRMASEKRAYTLSDRSTFLAQQEQLDLNILGQISDAFYWDNLSARFQNTPAPR